MDAFGFFIYSIGAIILVSIIGSIIIGSILMFVNNKIKKDREKNIVVYVKDLQLKILKCEESANKLKEELSKLKKDVMEDRKHFLCKRSDNDGSL
jgi:Na+-translocating ferredoxin:NAD+ oxidoreductase RnfG subunit